LVGSQLALLSMTKLGVVILKFGVLLSKSLLILTPWIAGITAAAVAGWKLGRAAKGTGREIESLNRYMRESARIAENAAAKMKLLKERVTWELEIAKSKKELDAFFERFRGARFGPAELGKLVPTLMGMDKDVAKAKRKFFLLETLDIEKEINELQKRREHLFEQYARQHPTPALLRVGLAELSERQKKVIEYMDEKITKLRLVLNEMYGEIDKLNNEVGDRIKDTLGVVERKLQTIRQEGEAGFGIKIPMEFDKEIEKLEKLIERTKEILESSAEIGLFGEKMVLAPKVKQEAEETLLALMHELNLKIEERKEAYNTLHGIEETSIEMSSKLVAELKKQRENFIAAREKVDKTSDAYVVLTADIRNLEREMKLLGHTTSELVLFETAALGIDVRTMKMLNEEIANIKSRIQELSSMPEDKRSISAILGLTQLQEQLETARERVQRFASDKTLFKWEEQGIITTRLFNEEVERLTKGIDELRQKGDMMGARQLEVQLEAFRKRVAKVPEKDEKLNLMETLLEQVKPLKRIYTGIWRDMSNSFRTMFSDVFRGELHSLGDAFRAWGNMVLDITSRVLAELATTAIVGGMSGVLGGIGWKAGMKAAFAGVLPSASAGAGAATIGAGSVGATAGLPPGFGHTGITNVPRDGLYNLLKGERVLAKGESAGKQEGNITILTVFDPNIIPAAMTSQRGEEVITNIITKDSLHAGVTRQVFKREGKFR